MSLGSESQLAVKIPGLGTDTKHIPPWEKEHHLQTCLGFLMVSGYLSFEEGISNIKCFTRNLRSVQKNHVWKTYGVTMPMHPISPGFWSKGSTVFPQSGTKTRGPIPPATEAVGSMSCSKWCFKCGLTSVIWTPTKARQEEGTCVILCVLWTKKLAHAPLSIAQQNIAWPRAADGAILFLRQAGQKKAPTKTIPV